jgi:orotate phosphoribosyltransferase
VERQGYTVDLVITVVDRQEGGGETLATAGYPLTAIFTRAELVG